MKTDNLGHRVQPKSERECINTYFSNYTTSMTVTCFDEDSEIHIIVRDGKQKAIYTMPVHEVERLRKWLSKNLKLQKDEPAFD